MQRSRRRVQVRRVPLLLLVVLFAVAGGAQAGPSVPVQVAFTPIATLLGEDFEDGGGGFTVGGVTSFAYGEPLSPPTTVVGQGPKMWGTNLTGDYGNLECGYLQSSPMDLTQVPAGVDPREITAARLSFRHWIHTENLYDAGLLLGSVNGTDWEVLTPVGGYDAVPLPTARACLGIAATQPAFTTASVPAADAWTVEHVNVSRFLGETLHVRWAFATDGSAVRRGWYIDDILVQLGAGVSAVVTAPDDVPVPFTPVTPAYAEDFEETNGSWVDEGTGAWEWGVPSDPPSPPTGSSAMWGTRLDTNYLSNECATLTSPAIDLGPAAAPNSELARATFKLWRDLESSYDGATLQISTGGAFATVPMSTYNGSLLASSVRACLGVASGQRVWTGSSADWTQEIVDLTPYSGKTVRFRLVFGSDSDTERRGVYVDDVAIERGLGTRIGAPDPNEQCAVAPGWSVTGVNPSWCYGVPSSGPGGPLPAYATNLAGSYKPSECSAIVSPAIPTAGVPGLGTLTLTFSQYLKTASSDDGGVVQVSKDDGATWSTVTPVGGYNTNSLGTNARACVAPGATSTSGFSGSAATSGYQAREVKLGSYQGEVIRVRFLFGSGPTTEDVGWYVRAMGLNRGAGNVPLLP